MSNIDRAADILEPHAEMWWTGSKEAAQDLDRNGLLAPAPQIVRTPADLEALDPKTWLVDEDGETMTAEEWMETSYPEYEGESLSVFAEASHVRACREALEGGAA